MYGNKLMALPQSFNQLKHLERLLMTIAGESAMVLDSLPLTQLTALNDLRLCNYLDISEYGKPRTQQQTQQFQQLCQQRGIELKWITDWYS